MKFRAALKAATIATEASGWGVVGYLPVTEKLMILDYENHQKLTAWGVQPILVLDVFEHAYSLKSTNEIIAIDEHMLKITARAPGGVYPDSMADARRLFVSNETGETETVIDVPSNRRDDSARR